MFLGGQGFLSSPLLIVAIGFRTDVIGSPFGSARGILHKNNKNKSNSCHILTCSMLKAAIRILEVIT